MMRGEEIELYARKVKPEDIFALDLKNGPVGGKPAGPFHRFLLFS